MTSMQRVAIHQLPHLKIFGKDHYSIDGSPVRDYTHVCDLAKGHVAALVKMNEIGFKGWRPYNLGTGSGVSVLEMIDAFEFITGRKIPYEIAPRR
jgi:UDP-glucose 4-epimerase